MHPLPPTPGSSPMAPHWPNPHHLLPGYCYCFRGGFPAPRAIVLQGEAFVHSCEPQPSLAFSHQGLLFLQPFVTCSTGPAWQTLRDSYTS